MAPDLERSTWEPDDVRNIGRGVLWILAVFVLQLVVREGRSTIGIPAKVGREKIKADPGGKLPKRSKGKR